MRTYKTLLTVMAAVLTSGAGAAEDGLQPPPAVLVRPQERAVAVVDEAVTVGPEDRHGAGGGDQRRGQRQQGPQPLATGK